MGKAGSRAYYKGDMTEVPPILREDTIETTGAGDTFCGCILNGILEKGLEQLTDEYLKEMLMFANSAASVITTRRGALRVIAVKRRNRGKFLVNIDRARKVLVLEGFTGFVFCPAVSKFVFQEKALCKKSCINVPIQIFEYIEDHVLHTGIFCEKFPDGLDGNLSRLVIRKMKFSCGDAAESNAV